MGGGSVGLYKLGFRIQRFEVWTPRFVPLVVGSKALLLGPHFRFLWPEPRLQN